MWISHVSWTRVLSQSVRPRRSTCWRQAGLEDAAGFKIDHAQRGLAVEAGAFVEMSVEEDEALGEGLRIVRVGMDDPVGVGCAETRVRGSKREKGSK